MAALPTGEEVKAGHATICSDENTLSISTSDKAIIEYQKFNVGKGELVKFIQPSKNSCVLNRVVGGTPSEILGHLQGNGRVFLVNPEGIYFGSDSVVNAGSFLATSLSIRDEDFLRDSFEFTLEPGVKGAIVNEGTIRADGFIALFAPTVENRGRLFARAEKIFVGAAEKVVLDLMGDGLIQFRVDGELEKALIENYGKIEAAGGDVQISLRTARKAVQSVLNTDGIEVAAGIEESNGVIRLVGASEIAARNVKIEGDKVETGGMIGAVQGEKGGTVQVLGDQISLMGALIDVSGETGGGTVLIGGDYQGKGAERNAQFTTIDAASKIYADAIREGDGGKVIVWADDTTLFDGKISALGGEFGGNGGFVETSGKENLGVLTGWVNTSAPKGKFGDWLLDPAAINVTTGGGGTLAQAANCGTNGTITIDPATINAAASNVILCAQRAAGSSITVNNAIAISTSGITLTMTAGSGSAGPITFNAGATTNAGAITVNGIVTLGVNTTLDTTNGGLAPAGSNITFNSTVDGAHNLILNGGTGGVVSYGAVGGTSALTALTATGATVTQNSTAKVTTGGIAYTGATAINLGGNLTTSASTVSMTGPAILNANLTIDTTNAGGSAGGAAITTTGNVSQSTTQTLSLNAGTGGVVSIGGNLIANALTVTNSGGMTITGTTIVPTVTLTNTTGNITFNGAATIATSLATAAQAYGVIFNNGGTITPATTFLNTGGITLKSGSSASLNFTNGVTHTAGATTVLGTVKTTAAAAVMSFGATTFSAGSSSLVTPAGTVGIAATTLSGNASIDTTNAGGSSGGGAITFSSTINGSNNLTLTAGGSSISFAGIVGGVTPLNVLTVSSANNVTAVALSASSIVQSAGTGTTTFNGAVNTTGASGISLTGTAFAINSAITTTSAGPLSIAHSGASTFGAGLTHTINGSFSDSGAGTTSLVGTINTNNQNISFGTAVTLTGTTNLSTNTGVGDILFSNTVTGAQNINLTAGTGNITFTGAVGATRLNTLTINSANNVTANALTLSIFNQVTGTGTTTFNGAVDLNNASGLTVITKNVTFNNTLNTTSGGIASIQLNTGTLILGSSAIFTLDGAFTQSGTGAVQAANSITTTNDTIQFAGAVTLTGSTVLNTGAGIGNIVFSSTVDGASALTLTAGTGNITFTGAAGSATRLGALTINSAANVTTAGIKASSINQTVASTGLTSLTGTIDCNGASGVQLRGSAITVNGSLITASGPFNIANTGTLNLTAGGSTLLGGAFAQTGGGAVNFSGTLLGNSVPISFANNITLTGTSTINSGVGAGSVTLSGTVDGAQGLTIASGTGNTLLSGAVGPAITSITFNSANNITTQAITAGAISQLGGAGTTTFNGNLITNTVAGISLVGTNFTLNGSVTTTTGSGPVNINNLGTLTLPVGFVGTVGGVFAQSGSGTTSLAGPITSTGALSFAGPITIVGTSPLLSTAAASQNITLSGLIDGSGNLALAAGGGSINLVSAVGSGTRLGTLTFTSALNVTAVAITAGSIVQLAGTGTTTFNGALNTNTAAGISLHLTNLTRSAAITTTAAGVLTIVNSGTFTSTAAGAMTIDGAFSQSGGGSSTIAGTLTTNNQPISFANAITLSNDTVLSSGAGAGDVTLSGTVNGTHALTLTAGTGSISLAGVIGGITPLTTLTFTSAANITAIAMSANSIVQSAGTGTTTFNGAVSTNTINGITLAGTAFQFNNTVTTTSAGPFALTNSGTAMIASAFNLAGAFSQTGAGSVSLGANITTTNGSVSFASPVSLTGAVTLNTGAGSGNILFSNTVDGTQTLTLTGGSGNVTISGAVGASTPLSSLNSTGNNITLANIGGASAGVNGSTNLTALTNLTFNGTTYNANGQTYSATTNIINAGALTTLTSSADPISFMGTVQLSAATNLTVNSTGGDITMGALRAGASSGRTVTLNAGTGTINLVNVGTSGNGEFASLVLTGGDIKLRGTDIFTNAISFSSSGGHSIFLGGNLTTAGTITFPIPVIRDTVLNATVTSTGTNILFSDILNGDVNLTRNLTLAAGSGSITFTGVVGGVHPLLNLTISSAANVTAGAITAGSITQSAGTGTTTFNGALSTSNVLGISLTGSAFTFNNTVATASGGPFAIANSGTLTLSSGAVFTLAGSFSQTGSGGVTLSGTHITDTTDNISFSGPVTLTTATTSVIDSSTANKTITFTNTIDSSGNLTLTAGTGSISLLGNTGDGTRIGAFSVTSAADVIVQDLFASSISITGFTGTLTLNGNTNTNGGAGIILTGNNFIRNGGITTTNGGNLQTTNTGTSSGSSPLPIDVDGSLLQLGTSPLNIEGTAISHTGHIEFHANPLTLVAPASITANVGSIQFFNPVNGTQTLALSAGTDITFSAAVGSVTPLGNIAISTARDVSTQAVNATSITQTTGTGTTTFGGAISTTGATGISISNNSIVRGAAITTTNGGPLALTIANGGTLTSTAAGAISVNGAITQSGTGAVSLSGTIGTTTAAISFAGPITMAADTSIGTGAGPGGITLSSTVQGAHNLTLDALGGNITLGGAAGIALTPLTSLTINHAANVSTQAITSATISQVTGTGTTTFNGALATSGASGITLAGTGFTFNAPFTTTGVGTVTITNSGLANIAGPGTVAKGLVINGTGTSQLSSSITAGDPIQILTNLAVTGPSSLDTSATGKLIEVLGTVTGTGSLTLSSGSGNILFLQNIASVGAFTISSAANVTMQGITATSIAQSGVTGSTIFNTDLSTSGPSGIGISGVAITFIGNVTAGGTGPITITNSGLLTTTDGTVFTAGGPFTQLGAGNLNLTGDIITNGTITFGTLAGPNGAITLIWPTTMNTGGSAGITIYDTIDGNFPLTLTAGTADINLNATVGGITPIGAFTVNSVHDLNVGSVFALSVAQVSGSGTFSVGTVGTPGTLSTTGASGVTSTGTNFFRHGTLTTTNGGSVTITNSGTVTGQIGNTTSINGSYILNGTGSLNFVGSATVNGAIIFAEPITLLGNATLTSGSLGITLGAINNDLMGAHTLTLNAGLGPVSLGAIGATTPVSAITINNASNVTTAAVSAASFSAPSFTGTALFGGAVSTTNGTGIVLTGPAVSFNSNVTTAGSGPLTITNTGLLTIANGTTVSLSGPLSQTGTGGTVSLGGSVISPGSISFAGPIALTATSSLDASSGAGNIVLSQTINGAFGLTLKAGTGTMTVTGIIGATTPPTSLILQGSTGITLSNTMAVAGPFTIVSAGGTTILNGVLTAAGDVTLGVSALTLNRTITTTGIGKIAITNSGAMTVSSAALPINSATTFTQSGGGSVSLGMNIISAGTLQFGSNILLTNAVTMNSGGGALTLANVNGAFDLTLAAGTGSITLGALGGITPLTNVTIQNAANVTVGAMTGTSLSSLTQTAGTGLTHFTGALSFGSSGITVTGSQFTFDGTIATSGAGPVSITHSGLLTLNSGVVATIGGIFVESGAGTVTTAANITTSGHDISFARPVTLSGTSTFNSGGGDIVLSNTVGGAFGLTLTAGAGLVQLDGAVSGLTSLVASGASIFQNSSVSTSGTVQETGVINLSGGITTIGNNITLSGNVTAAASLTLTTGAGAGNIHVTGTLNPDIPGRDFTASAGTGSVTFDGIIGALTPFHNFTVGGNTITMFNFGSSSPAATGTAAFTAATTITFNGTTYINGIQNYTAGTMFNFNAGAPTTITSINKAITFITGTINLSAGNDLTVNSNGGTITTLNINGVGGGPNLTLNASTGALSSGNLGGAGSLHDVTLTGTPPGHGTITATGLITITSATPQLIGTSQVGNQVYNAPVQITADGISFTAGNITFNGSLDANIVGSTRNITIVPGGGNSVVFNGPVGGIAPLTSIGINTVADVTANGTVEVGSLSQTSGTGTTTFAAGITTDTGGIAITTGNIVLSGGYVSAGSMALTNSGTLTATGIAAVVAGTFTETGTSTISGNITTSDGAVQFTGGVTLNGNLALNTVNSTGANISLATVDGAHDLTLTAGTGAIAFSGAVGTTRLGRVVISSAGNVTTSNIIKAASILQSAGTGTTTLGNLDTNAVNGIQLTGNTFIINGPALTTTAGGPLIITNSGNLSLIPTTGAIAGSLTQNGAGAVTAASGSFTVGGATSFASAVTVPIATTLSINTSATNQNITFSNTIAGPGGLTLNLGTGVLAMNGNASGLGAFSVPAVGAVSTSAIGASSIALTATGNAILNGNLTSTGATSLTGTAFTIDGILTAGSGFTIANSGILRLTTGVGSSISGGAFTQSGGGSVQLSGAITTVNQNLSFANDVTLEGAVALSTSAGAGNITLSSTVDGFSPLDLTAGTGTIIFGGALGSNSQLGALTIHSVNAITYPSVAATSISQLGNSGLTTITGPLTTTGASGVSFIGGVVTQNGNITALGSGPFSIQHSGTFTMATGSTTTVSGGAYTDSALSTGPVVLAGLIRTTNAPISFLGSGTITLGNDLALNSGAVGADITFSTAISGAHNMNLIANGGSIAFNGSLNIGNLTITSANNVTTGAITATTITQVSSLGLTHFQGVLSTSAAGGITLAGTAFTFDHNVTTIPLGSVSITNVGGTLTIPAASTWSLSGSLTQLGSGPSALSGNVTTGGAISFTGPVTMTGTPTLDASSGNNPITFLNTLDGPGGVTLAAGTGAVTFDFPVGGLIPFGALMVTGAGNVTTQAITAASIAQLAGSGTSLFVGDLNTSGASGIHLVGTAFSFLGSVTTAVSSTGPITIDNAGLLTFPINVPISSDGAFQQLSTAGTGSVSIGGTLITNNVAISFASPVSLSSSSTFNSGTGNITFSSSVDGSVLSSQDLILIAGDTGNILFQGTIGQTTRIGAFTVTNCNDLSLLGNVSSLSQNITSKGSFSIGTVPTAVNVDTSGPAGIIWTMHDFHRHGNITTTNSGSLFTFISGATFGHAGNMVTVDGSVTQTGPGTAIHFAGTITTNNHPISLLVPLIIIGDSFINSGSGGGDITLSGNIEGDGMGPWILNVSAGVGNAMLAGSVGATTSIGTLGVTGSTIQINGIGGAGVGVTGSTTLTATASIDFTAATYKANTQTYTSANLFDMSAGSLTTFTSSGSALMFNSGIIQLASNTDLTLNSSGGTITVGDVHAGTASLRAFTMNGGAGALTLGTVGTMGNTEFASLSLTGSTITLNGDIFSNAVTLTPSGTITAGGDITTVNTGLTFPTAVVLSGSNTFSTGTTGGNILFSSTLNSDGDQTRNLTLNAGTTGNITFTSTVGGVGHRLNALNITNANNVTAAAINAVFLTQSAGTGTTTFNGNVTVTGNQIIDLTGKNFAIPVGTIFTSSTNGLTVTNSGTLTMAGTLNLPGAFTQNGTGPTAFSGSITAGLPVSFATTVALSGTPSIDTSAASQLITFSGTVSGPGALTLTAGGGDISFLQAMGISPLAALGPLTISSSHDVNMAAAAFASLTSTSTGTFTLIGTGTASGNVHVTSLNVLRSGAWVTTPGSGGNVTITNSGALTNLSASTTSIDGSYIQNGTGPVIFAGTITTTTGNISYASPLTLAGVAAFDSSTGSGNITFSNTIDGTQNLLLNAGSGTITFSGAVGVGTRLDAFTIANAGTVSAQAITASSINQTTGSGTTTLSGDLNTNGILGISLSGTNFVRGGNWTTTGSGPITVIIPNTGSFTSTVAGTINASGAFNQNGTGAVSISRTINTTNAPITFNGMVTLAGSLTLDTGSGGGGNITFANTVDGGQPLNLNSGTGDTIFQAVVGNGTRLGAVSVSIANNVTFQFLKATSLSINLANGTTLLNGPTDVNMVAGVHIGGNIVTFNNSLTTAGNGPVVVNNTGLFSINANCSLAGTGAFQQIGSGPSTISGSIMTVNGAISFAGATFASGTANLTTSSQPITLSSTLDGPGNINLNPGAGGNITVLGASGALARLGTVQFTNANNISMTSLTASSITQSAGAGTTLFTGNLNTNGASGIALTGHIFTLNGTITTTSGGPVTITHTGLLTLAPGSSTLISGPFAESGAGGTVQLSGNLHTNQQNILFASPITLIAPTTLENNGTGNITLSNTVNGNTALVLDAGSSGNILILSPVGGTTPLQSLTITNVNNAHIQAAVTTGSLTQIGGTGTTFFTAPLMSTAIGGIVLSGNQFTFSSSVNTSTHTAPFFITNSGLLSFLTGSSITTDGPFSQLGTGLTSLATTITTVNDPVLFTGPVTLAGAVNITTATAVGTITFLNTVDGANNLTLSSGVGAISFSQSVSGLLSLQTTSAGNFTAEAVSAGSLTLSGISALGTFNGPLNISGPISLTGFGFTFNNSVTTTGTGSLTIANSGPLIISPSGAPISLDGIFNQSTLGPVSIGGSLTTNNNNVTFQGPIILSGDLTINTGSGAGNVTIANDLDGTHAMTIQAGTGDVACQTAFSIEEPLTSLTITGHTISLNGIGISNVGITGALTLTASGAINLTNSFYNAVSQTYSATSNTNFNNGSIMSLISHGPISFTNGGMHLTSGSDLSITTNNGALLLSNLTASSPEDVIINTGSGTAILSAMGGGINNVTVNAGEIFFGGSITALNTTFTSLGLIANLTVPVGINSTNTPTFNALGSDVGSIANPILVNTSNQIFAGACSSCLAAFDGTSIDNTVHALDSNPPCNIYFNGVQIKNCNAPPTPPAPSVSVPNVSRFFAVIGIYDSQFTLANDYFFLTYFLDEKYWRKSIPIFYRAQALHKIVESNEKGVLVQ